jgi:hypothetical protein
LFLDGLPVTESAQPAAWPKLVFAFVFDNVLPTERRISIGGTLALDRSIPVSMLRHRRSALSHRRAVS